VKLNFGEDAMQNVISAFLGQYENGKLTRRELVAGLAALAAVRPAAAAGYVRGVAIDHVSLQVRDLNVSRNFYTQVLGLTVLGEGGPENTILLGRGKTTFLILRNGTPPGTVDHFALQLEHFEKPLVAKALRERGVTAIDEGVGAGYHVKDPDGFNVQLV
jgi:catechol 2,3-dioxygenase-like lactoylglutathione lyase family enzyme